jgi:hypothetical protein
MYTLLLGHDWNTKPVMILITANIVSLTILKAQQKFSDKLEMKLVHLYIKFSKHIGL